MPVPVARVAPLCGALLVVVFAAGCGSDAGSTPGPPSTTPSTAVTPTDLPSGLSAQYLKLEVTARRALKDGGDKLQALPDPVPGAQLKPVLGPMADATSAFDQQLRQLAWPARLNGKVDAVVAADATWVADAAKLEEGASVSKADVGRVLGKDLAGQHTAIDRLRGELGLPPL